MLNTVKSQNPSGSPDNKSHRKHSFKKYRFSSVILRELRQCFLLNNWQGCFQVLEDWFLIAVGIFVSQQAWQNQSNIFGLLIYLITIVIIGARQRGLANLLHQATHRTLAKNKVLNFVLGTFLSGYLVLQSFTIYYYTHVLNHHPHTGHPELDGNYARLLKNGVYGDGLSTENVRRYLKNIVHPMMTLNYCHYLVNNKIFNSHEAGWERLARIAYLTVLTATILYLGWGNLLLLYWIVPLLTTANWIGAFIELAEHYPLMETAPKIDIYMSRNRLCNPLVNFLFSVHQEGYHLVHHLFPGIPFWRLKQAHSILLEDEVYASFNQDKGFLSLLKQLIPAAKN